MRLISWRIHPETSDRIVAGTLYVLALIGLIASVVCVVASVKHIRVWCE